MMRKRLIKRQSAYKFWEWYCRTPLPKSGTIAENIAYGNPEATRAEIIAEAAAASARMDLSSACPMGTIQSSRKMEGIVMWDRTASVYCYRVMLVKNFHRS